MIGGHARFIGQEVEGAEQVRSAVRAQIAAGAAVIKVIASGGVLTPGTSPDQAQMTVEELRAAVDERIDLLRDRSRIIGVMQPGKFVSGPLSKT